MLSSVGRRGNCAASRGASVLVAFLARGSFDCAIVDVDFNSLKANCTVVQPYPRTSIEERRRVGGSYRLYRLRGPNTLVSGLAGLHHVADFGARSPSSNSGSGAKKWSAIFRIRATLSFSVTVAESPAACFVHYRKEWAGIEGKAPLDCPRPRSD